MSGLEHLHGRRIIHRDLKPDNILLREETPLLADFGIARVRKTDYLSEAIGTLPYMAPESFDGKITEQVDLWAVGVILYQLLSGQLPFSRNDTTAVIGAIVYQEPAPLPVNIPLAIKDVVSVALQKDPQKRFRNAGEMRKALINSLKRPEQPSASRTLAEDISLMFPYGTKTTSVIPDVPVILTEEKLGRGTNGQLGKCDGEVYSLIVSPDDQSVFSGSDDKAVTQWDAESGARRVIGKCDWCVFSLDVSPDGKSIVSGSTDVRVWDLRTGRTHVVTKSDGLVKSVAFSPSGKYIISGSDSGKVRMWEISTGAVQFIGNCQGQVSSVAFSPDGKTVAIGSSDKTLYIWDVWSDRMRILGKYGDQLNAVSFSSDGLQLAFCGNDKTVRLWDLRTGSGKVLGACDALIGTLAFSREGFGLVTGDASGAVRAWDAVRGGNEVIYKSSKAIRAVAISSNDDYVATGGRDKSVRKFFISMYAS